MIRNLKRADLQNLMDFFISDRTIQQDERFDFSIDDIDLMLNYPHIFQYVFELDNQIVGYLCGYDMGGWGYIDILIVKSTHRNMSIATSLIETLLSQNLHWNIIETSCYSQDKDSISFIRKNGFDIEQELRWFGKELNYN
jgi:GNAT superfamily N-acetyltransferase